MAFYPFPRRTPTSISGPSTATAAMAPPNPWYCNGFHTHHHNGAHPSLSLSPVPRPPHAAVPPPAAADDKVELDEGLVNLFASAQLQRGSKRATRMRAAAATATHRKASGDMVLPAQEEAAARAAEHERQQAQERHARLYGSHAPELRALEATVNLSFDRAVRTRRPPLWPSVPLRSAAPPPGGTAMGTARRS